MAGEQSPQSSTTATVSLFAQPRVNGLGPDFEQFTQTRTGRVEPISFDTLTTLLLTQERRLQLQEKLQSADSLTRPTLNVASRGTCAGGGRGNHRRNSRGYKHNNGHNTGRSSDRGDSSNHPLSQICKKGGTPYNVIISSISATSLLLSLKLISPSLIISVMLPVSQYGQASTSGAD
ncbi:hypothetical protein H6P81_002693 [Aristolochia fimbriata]|uniref:Uncharacterized protein n=1 Tax=Aristolochia fimbriata TaxID=158543 RepID=A0AAV7FDB9_ARIFI|nr:hypothetical protein H6P81_002693 [Aristolochia fimbriata]